MSFMNLFSCSWVLHILAVMGVEEELAAFAIGHELDEVVVAADALQVVIGINVHQISQPREPAVPTLEFECPLQW